jgi:multimeric flavodoxin WrbA
MKVFVYYGNKENRQSRSFKFVEQLINELNGHHAIDSVVIRSATNVELNFMFTWDDVLFYAEKTDKKKIAQEMLQADVIIIISPVFMHHVSAHTKVFLDNFASWGHTMPLIGKVGIPISLSNNNGNTYVDEYLTKIMNCFGLTTVKSLSLQLEHLNEQSIESYIRFVLTNVIGKIDYVLSKNKDKDKLETIYRANKSVMELYDESNLEKRQFNKLGYDNCETYESALLYRRKHRLIGTEL